MNYCLNIRMNRPLCMNYKEFVCIHDAVYYEQEQEERLD
jgi:hypothetical protein